MEVLYTVAVNHPPIQAAHSAVVADLVQALVADYREPALVQFLHQFIGSGLVTREVVEHALANTLTGSGQGALPDSDVNPTGPVYDLGCLRFGEIKFFLKLLI